MTTAKDALEMGPALPQRRMGKLPTQEQFIAYQKTVEKALRLLDAVEKMDLLKGTPQ